MGQMLQPKHSDRPGVNSSKSAEKRVGPRDIVPDYEYRPPYDPTFVGRELELQWLDKRLFDRDLRHSPILITGVGGVGKTALLRQFLASLRISSTPLWLDLSSSADPEVLGEFIDHLYKRRSRHDFIVVLDGADALTDTELQHTVGRVFNLKAVRSLVIATRRTPSLHRAETLALTALSSVDAARLFQALSSRSLSQQALEEAIRSTHGFPLAVSLLVDLLANEGPDALSQVLSGQLYDLSTTISEPSTQLVTSVVPTIITANEALVTRLKKQPEAIYDLPPRRFEEVLAELLTDMGWEVELTQATRDGGKDILAYLNTDLGRLLCLVEAKKYRRDRKVGIDLVRKLYGTLCDSQANSAMLVTTSSFTSGAKEFQQRHKYQLALREYADVVQWLQNHRPNAV